MDWLALAFGAQITLAIGAFFLGRGIARRRPSLANATAALSLATMLLFPLARVFPVEVVRVLGAPAASCVELTALAIPAVLFFSTATQIVPRASDRRALSLLNIVAAIYFVRAGIWMVLPPPSGVGPTRIDADGICRQTTGYTCVAASMVTMLRARGIAADEAEMSALCRTQSGGGATDSRALWALDRKLAGTAFTPRYARLNRGSLIAAPKPCMVQLDWGFFVSHMVPVMEATPDRVVIGDPLSGTRTMSMADFEVEWKGLAITLETPTISRSSSPKEGVIRPPVQ